MHFKKALTIPAPQDSPLPEIAGLLAGSAIPPRSPSTLRKTPP